MEGFGKRSERCSWWIVAALVILMAAVALGVAEGFDVINNSETTSVLLASVDEAGEVGPWTEVPANSTLQGMQAGAYMLQNAITGNEVGPLSVPDGAIALVLRDIVGSDFLSLTMLVGFLKTIVSLLLQGDGI